jgi:hypothetical protein
MNKAKTQLQDEIESVKVVNVHVYKSIQRENFARVNTLPQEWRPCEIRDIVNANGKESIIFDIPDGYQVVTPHSDSLSADDRFLLQSVFQSNKICGVGCVASCELCGHGIKYQFPLRNDTKKLLMYVGSVCVNTFMNAKYVQETIIKFKETKLRRTVNSWKRLAVMEIWSNPEFKENTYGERILYEYWKFAKKLQGIDVEMFTSRKLVNILREAKGLKINIPLECESIILTKKEKAALQNGGN